jgi:NADP-dependent 3-hydroxy acid dehydrogenase YdfG
MTESIAGKVALITGASSGIGKACAEILAKANSHLVLVSRRLGRLDILAQELKRMYGIKVYTQELDVRDSKGVRDFVDSLPEDFQPIDILINSAGLALGTDLIVDANLDDWNIMIDTNLKGMLHVVRSVLPQMLKNQKGLIVNISSIAGHLVYPGGSVYCATKHAVSAITKAIKLECKGTPIRVTDVGPGLVETEFSIVRFKGDVDKAAQVYEDVEALRAEDIAEIVHFVATRPPHVMISDIVPTATKQTLLLH